MMATLRIASGAIRICRSAMILSFHSRRSTKGKDQLSIASGPIDRITEFYHGCRIGT